MLLYVKADDVEKSEILALQKSYQNQHNQTETLLSTIVKNEFESFV